MKNIKEIHTLSWLSSINKIIRDTIVYEYTQMAGVRRRNGHIDFFSKFSLFKLRDLFIEIRQKDD